MAALEGTSEASGEERWGPLNLLPGRIRRGSAFCEAANFHPIVWVCIWPLLWRGCGWL